jgi:hypothetical protein
MDDNSQYSQEIQENQSEELGGRPYIIEKSGHLESFNCPNVVVSLQTLHKIFYHKKNSSIGFSVPDSLQDRQIASEHKISNLRMIKKAEEVSEMRPAPEINQVSKNIIAKKYKNSEESNLNSFMIGKTLSNKKDSKLASQPILNSLYSIEKSSKISGINNQFNIRSTLLSLSSSEVFKSIFKDEIQEKKDPDTDAKGLDVVERTKDWKERKDKKIGEIRKEKRTQELNQCTFKPTLISKNNLNDVNSMNSSVYKLTNNKKSLKNKSYIGEIKVSEFKYTQLSPALQKIKYDAGFNVPNFLKKAVPMASYSLLDED